MLHRAVLEEASLRNYARDTPMRADFLAQFVHSSAPVVTATAEVTAPVIDRNCDLVMT